MNNTHNSRPESNSKKSNDSKKGVQWWWMAAFLLAALLIPSLVNNSFQAKEINWQQFKTNMLDRKAVERIVIINNEKAEVYIKSSFVNDTTFKEVLNLPLAKALTPDHIIILI